MTVETYTSTREADQRLRSIGAVYQAGKSTAQRWIYWVSSMQTYVIADRTGSSIRLSFSKTCGC